MATELKASDLVRSRLPSLLEGPSKTTSDSTHSLEFKALLIHWKTFEKDVRRNFESITWDRHSEILAYAPPTADNNRNHLSNEQLYCGDEHSVVARFGQNVGHVMTGVYQSLGIKIRFGDSKACSDSTLGGTVPDIIVINNVGKPKIVGEAKTPWMHKLGDTVLSDQKIFRKSLGQISQYMFLAKLKYGFLTTYNKTIFLMQEPHPRKPNQWALWHSDLISHDTQSANVGLLGVESAAYRNKVSLRECFLFLGKEVESGRYTVANPVVQLRWYGPTGGDFVDEDYLSLSDDPSSTDISKASPSSNPASKPSRSRQGESAAERSTRSQSRMMLELETQTGSLNISGQHGRGPPPTRGSRSEASGSRSQVTVPQATASRASGVQGSQSPITASYHAGTDRWYYKDQSGKVFVDLEREEHRGRYFFRNGAGQRTYVTKESKK